MTTELTKDLTVPTVHLNGSGYDNLHRDYRAALAAVREAREKLPRPHGRDYYVQEAGALEKALSQFTGQLRKLEEIETELTHILMGVQDQRR
jgi:hypothetical protein